MRMDVILVRDGKLVFLGLILRYLSVNNYLYMLYKTNINI